MYRMNADIDGREVVDVSKANTCANKASKLSEVAWIFRGSEDSEILDLQNSSFIFR